MWTDDEGSSVQERGSRYSADSEVVLIDDNTLPRNVQETPIVAQITNSSQVHVGPKIVTVNQTVHNGEIVKGRFLCLELVSPNQSNRLRCGVAVFVCWALVVASSFGVYFLFIIYNHNTRFDIPDLQEDWYLRRKDWQALPPYEVEFLHVPVEEAVITHSVTTFCNSTVVCKKQVLAIQQDHMIRRYGDIGPNFIVSGNGLVFEGRGANVVGATLQGYNRQIISIMFLGDYRVDVPTKEQIDHVNILLNYLEKANLLRSDYKVLGACQKVTYTINPGPQIMWRMSNFPHWVSTNANKCLNSTVS